MIFLRRMPRLPRWILSVVMIFLTLMTLMRLIFFFRFDPPGKAFSGSAMIMGLRFDLKFICILAIFILVLCSIPFINPFRNYKAKKFWNIFLTFIFFATLLFYIADYYHYDWLRQRLNASVFSYFQAEDAGISFNVGLESYPIFSIISLLVLGTFAGWFVLKRSLEHFQTQQLLNRKKGIGWYIIFVLITSLGVFGKVGQFNLRWSDAFSLSDNFKANMALNPFQSFFSTLRFRDTKPDTKTVRSFYPIISDYLNVKKKDSIHLNYERDYAYQQTGTPPNVILVICESFSMYRSSMSGNHFNTTPFFNELTKKGVFFERCFTPSFPTARGVWATITSIPDVLGDNNRTASRNPEVVNQQTIINNLKGYEKFYFIGGDPSWANIKGVLMNNIDSLHLYSQDDFKSKKVDVWGIDDKNLLLESAEILEEQRKPFFAVIQTADNHRPYTIPHDELKYFKKANYPKDSIIKYGFEDIDQLNAFRYTDYCFQQFIESAQKKPYFDNTIFVFIGDHGIAGDASQVYPKSWNNQLLAREHVPLLFYAPKLLQPKQVKTVCSQVDVIPSIATLLKMPHSNNSMGQSLFDTTIKKPASTFIIDHDARTIGMVTDDYYYLKNTKTGRIDFVSVTNNDAVPKNNTTDSIKKQLGVLTDAYYYTSKYLLFNNKRKTGMSGK